MGPQVAARRDPLAARLRREDFQGTVAGKPVDLITLVNTRGGELSLTNQGAKLVQWLVPDRHGVLGDVLLGYDTLDALLAGHASMNAFIGRYANRIGGARFTLDGTTHMLSANDGPNTLHGGTGGSRMQTFGAQLLSPSAVELRYTFGDGEQGFPGRLPLRLVYTLGDDHSLTMAWSATAEGRATVASFTGHAFFNLSGDPRSPVGDHVLSLPAEHFLPVDALRLPTGEVRPVAGTAMDFRQGKALRRDIDTADEQLQRCAGYDHFFILPRAAQPCLALAARLVEPVSGRVLEVWTTEPGLQLYSGNHLGSEAPCDLGKGGLRFGHRSGLCLEPSHYPDAPNQPGFPSTVLRPGQTCSGRIVYRFSTAA